MRTCNICKRPLDTAPELEDCGGDCLESWLNAEILMHNWQCNRFFWFAVVQAVQAKVMTSAGISR